jgi:hypothetical protein
MLVNDARLAISGHRDSSCAGVLLLRHGRPKVMARDLWIQSARNYVDSGLEGLVSRPSTSGKNCGASRRSNMP